MKLVKEFPDSGSQEEWLARERAHLSQVLYRYTPLVIVPRALTSSRSTVAVISISRRESASPTWGTAIRRCSRPRTNSSTS